MVRITFFVLMTGCVLAHAVNATPAKVIDCDQANMRRKGVGVAFRGTVVNGDYLFSVKIPKNLTGWSGVASSAPFHGFNIFFDPKTKACIIFNVHVRIDDSDAPELISGTSLHFGKAQGLQSTRAGEVMNEHMTNVSTIFSIKRINEVIDGEVILITPTSNLSKLKPIYDSFLLSLKFRE